MKAIFKYDNGNVALLCSNCHKIIKEGWKFSEKESKAIKGEVLLSSQYCEECTNKRKDLHEIISKLNHGKI